MTGARRLAAQALDSAPVLILAGIAGAGSFVHIRDTAAQHGQHGPMSWAIAVCIDLTCVMAARERQHDKRTARAAGRLSWPVLVLAAGVLLSLAANLDQAQPDPWGRITAATPAAAFLVAVSMLERRAAARHGRTARTVAAHPVLSPDGQDDPVRAIPSQNDGQDRPVPAIQDQLTGPPGMTAAPGTEPADALIQFARRIAAEHHAEHGQPITRDTLRARLGVSNQLASSLLRHIRATPENTGKAAP
jgi:hypothetical protein